MTKTGSRLFTLCCLLGFPGLALASILGRISFAETYDLPVGPAVEASNAITIRVAYSIGPGGLEDATTTVFEDLLFTGVDALRVVSLTSAADDAEFPAFLSRATNGTDDDFRVTVIGNRGGGRGTVAPESTVLVKSGAVPGPDLAGTTIGSLELFIEQILFHPDATIGEFNWSVSGELRFLSAEPTTVPLPPALLLLAGGLLVGTRRRARA